MRISRQQCAGTLIASVVLLMTGCDPVRTTQQTVRLSITDSKTDESIPNLSVRLKDEFDVPTSDPHYEHLLQTWRDFPWFDASTNSEGLATVKLVYTSLDGSRGKQPPKSRNRVTGTSFIIELCGDISRAEQLTVILDDGATATGTRYNVLVKLVEDPIYIPTK